MDKEKNMHKHNAFQALASLLLLIAQNNGMYAANRQEKNKQQTTFQQITRWIRKHPISTAAAAALIALPMLVLTSYSQDARPAPTDLLAQSPALHPPRSQWHRGIMHYQADKKDQSATDAQQYNEQWDKYLKTLNTELIKAINKNKQAQVKNLLEAKANVNSTNGSRLGHPPLIVAARLNRIEIIKDLLNMRADINAQDPNPMYNTALHYTAHNAFPEATKILLENKADPTIQIEGGYTPLKLAQYSLAYRTSDQKEEALQVIKILKDAEKRMQASIPL